MGRFGKFVSRLSWTHLVSVTILLAALTVFIIVVICNLRKAPIQSQIVSVLRQREFGVTYDWQWDPITNTSPTPSILRPMLGENICATVVVVSGITVSDDDLRWICQLPHLVELDVPLTDKVTDVGLERIGELVELRRLPTLLSHSITDNGVRSLSNLGKLEILSITGRISDSGLAVLANMKKLRALEIHSPLLTDNGVLLFEKAGHLRELRIYGGSVSDNTILRMRRLPLRTFVYRHDL